MCNKYWKKVLGLKHTRYLLSSYRIQFVLVCQRKVEYSFDIEKKLQLQIFTKQVSDIWINEVFLIKIDVFGQIFKN